MVNLVRPIKYTQWCAPASQYILAFKLMFKSTPTGCRKTNSSPMSVNTG